MNPRDWTMIRVEIGKEEVDAEVSVPFVMNANCLGKSGLGVRATQCRHHACEDFSYSPVVDVEE